MGKIKSYTELKRRGINSSEMGKMDSQPNTGALIRSQHTDITSLDSLVGRVGLTRNAALDVIAAAAMDGVGDAVKIIEVATKVIDAGDETTLAKLCKEAGVKQSTAIGLLVQYISQYQQGLANLKSAMYLGDIVDATAAQAMQPSGLEEKKIMLKNQNFIRDEKNGPLVQNINVNSGASGPQVLFEKLIKGELQAAPATDVVEGEIVDGSK